MKKLGVLLCLIGLSGTAWSESLIVIGTANNVVLYGDLSSRTSNRAWFTWKYIKPQKSPFNPKKFYIEAKDYVEINCATRQLAGFTSIYYSRSGKAIDNWTPRNPQVSYVIPGTWGESMYQFVCYSYPQ